MLIIWRGAGVLVIGIVILACLLMNILTDAVFHDAGYYEAHGWPKLMALWGSGAACWFIGKHLNGKPGRILIDKATGQEVHLKPNHSLFFVPVEYWGPILFAIGICYALMN